MHSLQVLASVVNITTVNSIRAKADRRRALDVDEVCALRLRHGRSRQEVIGRLLQQRPEGLQNPGCTTLGLVLLQLPLILKLQTCMAVSTTWNAKHAEQTD